MSTGEEPGCLHWTSAASAGARAAAAPYNANCVEVAVLDGAVAVRDSKHPTGGMLAVSPSAWTAFTTALSDSQFY